MDKNKQIVNKSFKKTLPVTPTFILGVIYEDFQKIYVGQVWETSIFFYSAINHLDKSFNAN